MVATIAYQTNIPHSFVKSILEKELTKLFKWDVSIEKMSGSLITGITCYDVTFKNHELFKDISFTKAKKIKINYNPINLIIYKGDGAAATSLIEIYDMDLNIIRNKDDNWTLFHIFPPPPPGVEPLPPTFKGKIKFYNVDMSFTDQIGWKKDRLKKDFKKNIKFFRGEIDFKNYKKVLLTFTGKTLNNKPVNFFGHFNSLTAKFDYKFNIKPSLDGWGDYFLPIDDYYLAGEISDISGRIISKQDPEKNKTPFWYYIELKLENGDLKIPYFEQRINKLNGKLVIKEGSFTNKELKSKKVKKLLVDNNILSEDGFLKDYKSVVSLNINKRLKKTIFRPGVQLEFYNTKGKLENIPLSMYGKIDINNSKINLDFSSQKMDLINFKKLFSGINKWNMSGLGKLQFSILGELDKPMIKGLYLSDQLYFYGLKPVDNVLSFEYFESQLSLKMLNSTLYQGDLKLDCNVDFNQKTPDFDASIYLNKASIKSTFDKIKKYTNGTYNVELYLNGKIDHYFGNIAINSDDLFMFNQKFDQLHSKLFVRKNTDIFINSGSVQLNNALEKTLFSGVIEDNKYLKMKINSSQIVLSDIFKYQQNEGSYGALNSSFSATLNDNFWKNPLYELEGNLMLSANNLKIYDKNYDKCNLKILFNKEKLVIDKLFLLKNLEIIDMKGVFDRLLIHEMDLSFKNVIVDESSYVQKFLPSIAKPYKGDTSLNLKINKNMKDMSDRFNLLNYDIKSNIDLKKGMIQGQQFDKLSLNLDITDDKIQIKDGDFRYKYSECLADLVVKSKKYLSINLKKGTKFNVKDFHFAFPFTSKYLGSFKVHGNISGFKDSLNYKLYLDGNDLAGKYLTLNSLKGHVDYKANDIKLNDMRFNHEGGRYSLDLFLKNHQSYKSFNDLEYDLDFKTEQADIRNFLTFLEDLYKEINSNKVTIKSLNTKLVKSKTNKRSKELIRIEDKRLTQASFKIYDEKSLNDPISIYNDILFQQNIFQNQNQISLNDIASGKLDANIKLKKRTDMLEKVNININALNVFMRHLKADKISFLARNKDDVVDVKTNVINGKLGAKVFDELIYTGELLRSGDLLTKKAIFKINDDFTKNIVTGRFPIEAYWNSNKKDNVIDLKINLDEDNIDVLTVFNKYIERIENKGDIYLRLTGTLDAPLLNAEKYENKDFKVRLYKESLFQTPFNIKMANWKIQNNKLIIPSTNILWSGIDTNNKDNNLNVSGNIDIEFSSLLDPSVITLNMNLLMKKTNLHLSLKSFYTGYAKLNDVKIHGPYLLALTDSESKKVQSRVFTNNEVGPEISTYFELENGEITIPSVGKKY